MTKGSTTAMSTIAVGGQAAARAARPAPAHCLAGLRQAARAAMVSAGTVLLTAACGSVSSGPAASPSRLYQRSLTYSRCMRSHGVPDFPLLKPGPAGSLVHPVSPPAGMLTAPGYDAAFLACLRLAVFGERSRARYQAVALHGLKEAECMRAHGITRYPSPAASTRPTSPGSASTRTHSSSRPRQKPVARETSGR